MGYVIDIDIDWNEEDDTGLAWTLASRAADPDAITPGRYVIAGRGAAIAVAQVVDRDNAGVVHLRPLQGAVAEHVHLTDASQLA